MVNFSGVYDRPNAAAAAMVALICLTAALAQKATNSDTAMFEDVTAAVLGGSRAFSEQFSLGAGEWAEMLDAASGIDFYGLNGVAAADYDGDGWDDFFVCQPGGLPGRLFRNAGDGTFHDVTSAAGLQLLDPTSAALFADYDNDGDQDLFLITAGGILLFEADGRGHFSRSKRAQFRIPQDEQGSLMMPAIADYDGDGLLDLYVCGYSLRSRSGMANYLSQPTPYFDANNGAPNQLFRNNGDGTFTNITAKSGMSANNHRWSFAASWGDYNLDGRPDLYVANDFGRNNLYRNNGDGTFTDVAEKAGVEDIGAGMSAAWGDVDNDGRDDLFISNIWSAAGQRIMQMPAFQPLASPEVRNRMRRFARGNSLYRNRGETFDDMSQDVANGGWAWGGDFLDADNDGWEDLLVVNGHITNDKIDDLESFHWTDVLGKSPVQAVRSRAYEEGWRSFQSRMNADGWSVHGREKKKFYRNTGSGHFADISAQSGLDFDDDGRAFAVFDFDKDGALDIVMKNRTAPQVRVLRNNNGGSNRSVAFDLVGVKSNRDAIGARVTFSLAGNIRTKQVRAGSGFLSQHTRKIYFGMGDAKEVTNVRIDWPSGLSQEFKHVPTGAIIHIKEGDTGFRAENFAAHKPITPTQTAESRERPVYSGTWLTTPVPMPNLQLVHVAGKGPKIATLKGPQELSVQAGDGGSETNYSVNPAVDRVLNSLVKNLFARRRDAGFPVTLLLDGRGEIVKIYRGAIRREFIIDDVRRLPMYEADRNRFALPFPGEYYGSIGNRLESFFLIALDCLQAGLDDDALNYFEQCLRLDPGLAAVHSNVGSIRARQGRLEQAIATFRRAAELDPQSADIQFNLGTTLAMAGRQPEGVKALAKAAGMDPASAEIWTNLGNAYLDIDQPALARRPLERAVELKPASAVIHNSLGTLYHQVGRTELARKQFEEAIRLQPDYDSAYLNLGLLYLREDRTIAKQMFKKALELNPANVEARRLLDRNP